MVIDGLEARTNDHPFFIERRDFAESIFGDLAEVKESDKNPEWLVKKLTDEHSGTDRKCTTGMRYGRFPAGSKPKALEFFEGIRRGGDLRRRTGRT